MSYQFILKRFDLDIKVVKSKITSLSKGVFSIDPISNRLVFLGNLDPRVESFPEIDKVLKEEKNKTPLKFQNLKEDCKEIAKKYNKVALRIKMLAAIKLSSSSLKKKIADHLVKSNIHVEEDAPVSVVIELWKEQGAVYYRILSHKNKVPEENKFRYKNLMIVIENPRTKEELSSILRLAVIFNVPLKIIHKEKEQIEVMINNAKKITKGKLSRVNVEIVNSLDHIHGHVKIGFSIHAKHNEDNFVDFLEKSYGKKIAFVVGDDRFGLSQGTRDKVSHLFKLTQESKKPLKADQTLAYALGMYNILTSKGQ